MDTAFVICPYCGQSIEVIVDPGGARHQEYVEDCEVCCRPWRVVVDAPGGEPPEVTVYRLDD